jgi:hypothetical protein
VLDRIERRRFLIQPSRKDALPALVGSLNVELDEGAGKLLELPGRRSFASAQAHDRVLDLNRLARTNGEVANDAVALVEQAEHGNPLRHRGNPCLIGGSRGRRGRRGALLRRGSAFRLLLTLVASADRERKRKGEGQTWPHA